jgi:hypothetical protein
MNEIKWDLLNRANENLSKVGLCRGEADTLSADEIHSLNLLLEMIAVDSEAVKNISQRAKQRFRDR